MIEAEKTANKWIVWDQQMGTDMRYRAVFNSLDMQDAIIEAKKEVWDLLHSSAPCGHARANWRDPKYGTKEYVGSEQCEMCAKDATIASLRKENERLKESVEYKEKLYVGLAERVMELHDEKESAERELAEYKLLCQGHVLAEKKWQEELEAVNGKVERAIAYIHDQGDDPNDILDILFDDKQILEGK